MTLRWPELSSGRLADWRLPDAALWLVLLGLGLLVARWPTWSASAWTLLINVGLAYCVQGVAVVESLLLARGVPLSVIIITLLFMSVVALPALVLAAVALGLSDVWLDYRKLEPASHADDE